MKIFAFAFLFVSGALFAHSPQVPLVTNALDDKGQEHMVATAEWEKIVTQVSQTLEGNVLSSLDQAQVPFKLKSVVVGLGINAEVGVTSVLTLGAQARVRLVFCPKGQAPVVP